MRAVGIRYAAAILAATSLVWAASPARAKVRVFSCEPEWAALAEQLGGDHVDVSSATSAH